MGSIQRCILGTTGRILFTPVSENTCSDGITSPKRDARYNHHEYLTKIRKSEKTLQCSNWGIMIEASMCEKFDNCDNNFYQMFGKSDQATSTHMTYGRDYYFFEQNFRNYSIDDYFFKVICAPISLSFMPIFL